MLNVMNNGRTLSALLYAKMEDEGVKRFKIVGEWLWANTVYEAGVDGAEKICSRYAEMGITDIVLLVKGNLGRIAYLKGEAALARSDYEGRDILQEVLTAAHAQGLRVHAWICHSGDATYKETFPEAGMYHYVKGRDNNRINLYDPGYRSYMEKVVTELLRDYDVDGLHFDYIRYNHLANGWSEIDFANLKAMGANVAHIQEMVERTLGFNDREAEPEYIFEQYNSGDPDAQLIAEYRRSNVVSYAKMIAAAARAVKPDIILSAALMPEGAYDLAFADLHYGQNYADLSALVDFIMPMTYSLDYHQDSAWVTKVAVGALEKGGKVLVGLQAYGTATTEQLNADAAAVRGLLSKEADAAVADAEILEAAAGQEENLLGIALFRTGEFRYAKMSELGAEDLDQAMAKIREVMPGAGCVYIVSDQ